MISKTRRFFDCPDCYFCRLHYSTGNCVSNKNTNYNFLSWWSWGAIFQPYLHLLISFIALIIHQNSTEDVKWRTSNFAVLWPIYVIFHSNLTISLPQHKCQVSVISWFEWNNKTSLQSASFWWEYSWRCPLATLSPLFNSYLK